MIVWGGAGQFDFLNTGGRYDPAQTPGPPRAQVLPLRDGALCSLDWHQNDCLGRQRHIRFFKHRRAITTRGWIVGPATSTFNAPDGRTNPTSVWTGNEMIAWGGLGPSLWVNTGGRYCVQSGLRDVLDSYSQPDTHPNRNSHGYSHSDANSHSYCHSDGDAYTDSNTNNHSNSYGYRDGDTYNRLQHQQPQRQPRLQLQLRFQPTPTATRTPTATPTAPLRRLPVQQQHARPQLPDATASPSATPSATRSPTLLRQHSYSYSDRYCYWLLLLDRTRTTKPNTNSDAQCDGRCNTNGDIYTPTPTPVGDSYSHAELKTEGLLPHRGPVQRRRATTPPLI